MLQNGAAPKSRLKSQDRIQNGVSDVLHNQNLTKLPLVSDSQPGLRLHFDGLRNDELSRDSLILPGVLLPFRQVPSLHR